MRRREEEKKFACQGPLGLPRLPSTLLHVRREDTASLSNPTVCRGDQVPFLWPGLASPSLPWLPPPPNVPVSDVQRICEQILLVFILFLFLLHLNNNKRPALLSLFIICFWSMTSFSITTDWRRTDKLTEVLRKKGPRKTSWEHWLNHGRVWL